MRNMLAYEEMHVFRSHHNSIALQIKQYKKDLAIKNPKAIVDEDHMAVIEGQPMRHALQVSASGLFRFIEVDSYCANVPHEYIISTQV